MVAARLLRLYPRAWRDRYAEEFLAMIGPEHGRSAGRHPHRRSASHPHSIGPQLSARRQDVLPARPAYR